MSRSRLYFMITSQIKLNAIILVPEITKGMKSIGSKALISIDHRKSIIEHQIEYLQKNYTNIDIAIATGFDADKIQKKTKRYNITTIHNDRYDHTNHGMSLFMYLQKMKSVENLLIISNGILLKEKLPTSINESIIYALTKKNNDYAVGLNITEENRPAYLFYDFPISWSECVFLNAPSIEKLREILTKDTMRQMFLFEIINYLLDSDCKFKTEKIANKNICKVTTIKNTKKAKTFYD